MRTYAVSGFVLLTITMGAVLAAAAAQPGQLAAADTPFKEAPLTISVSTVGQFSSGSSWHLIVNSAGQAELTIDTFPDRTSKRFQLSQEQLDEFRTALTAERFFELSGEYGQKLPGGSESTLTVTAGRHANTVRVGYLMNWVAADKAKLREPSRAVRLLVLVRGWFESTAAVDLRPFDRRMLDAAKESLTNPSP